MPTPKECKAYGYHYEDGDCKMCKQIANCAYQKRISSARTTGSIADSTSVVAIARILFNLEYAAYNLCGKTVEDLPLGLSESTGADDSLLIAIRDLKEIERGMQL